MISMQENMSARTLTLSSSAQRTIVRFVKLPLVDKIPLHTAWISLEKLLVFLCSYVLQSANHGHYFVIFMVILRRLDFMRNGSCKSRGIETLFHKGRRSFALQCDDAQGQGAEGGEERRSNDLHGEGCDGQR
uniref:Uncharacterized protein n=1 Tax=Zea mays TaxID=4577 RepID=A0A804PDQ6_MAIZE